MGSSADNYLYRKFDSKSIEAKSDNKTLLYRNLGLMLPKTFLFSVPSAEW